jgi:hypothetical protein
VSERPSGVTIPAILMRMATAKDTSDIHKTYSTILNRFGKRGLLLTLRVAEESEENIVDKGELCTRRETTLQVIAFDFSVCFFLSNSRNPTVRIASSRAKVVVTIISRK